MNSDKSSLSAASPTGISTPTDAQRDMLANRLRKNCRRWHCFFKKAQTDCYRLYGQDIPEYPLNIDWYAGKAVAWMGERLRDDTPEKRENFRAECLRQLPLGLNLAPEHIFIKERRPGGQYRKEKQAPVWHIVHEAGLSYFVNLSSYHDTGLFPDHRPMRALVRQHSLRRSVLNLFCYTGSFSLNAAAGGAKSITSVDISENYLNWLERNLELNRLSDDRHTLVRANVLSWLEHAMAQGLRYDLIVCDPPTFSNSKRMERLMDINRDYAFICRACLHLLNPGGQLYFSTNKRGFQPLWPDDIRSLIEREELAVTDITNSSIPPDFAGHFPHRAWLLERALHRVTGR